MLSSHITLPGSRDFSGGTQVCNRCENKKLTNDGVDIGNGRWVCGNCWRGKAARLNGAAAAFAKPRSK